VLTFYRLIAGPALRLAHRLLAVFNGKARRGLAGRRRWREQLAGLQPRVPGQTRVHVHVASVGEFEGAKPIIERLREQVPYLLVTASFFSPSGYEQQSGWKGLDAACYLPEDRTVEMRAFLDRLDPDLLLLIRYDLWPELLRAAHGRGVPTVLACGVLHARSVRLRWPLRSFFRSLYGLLDGAWTVRAEDRESITRLAPTVPSIAVGDTRYDRVLARAAEAVDLQFGEVLHSGGEPVLVAGSTWGPDEEMLSAIRTIYPALRLVVVPHEPSREHVGALQERFPDAVTLSQLDAGVTFPSGAVLIVDRTGLLSALYRLGDIAWVGGGWGAGVHSVLEPAAYNLPVLTGPHIERSPDAVSLHRNGGLRVVHDAAEARAVASELRERPEEWRRRGEIAGALVREGEGATERIVAGLLRLLASRSGSS